VLDPSINPESLVDAIRDVVRRRQAVIFPLNSLALLVHQGIYSCVEVCHGRRNFTRLVSRK
jgi:hypothetical protein